MISMVGIPALWMLGVYAAEYRYRMMMIADIIIIVEVPV